MERRKTSTMSTLRSKSMHSQMEGEKTWYIVITVIVLVAVLAVLVIIYLKSIEVVRETPAPDDPSACGSAACLEYVHMVRQRMDPSANPCANFYNFTCNGNSNTTDKNWISVIHDHKASFSRSLGKLMNTMAIPTERQTAIQKAAAFYQSCYAVVTGKLDEFSNFKRIIQSIGIYWPRPSTAPDGLHLLMSVYKTFKIDTILSIRVINASAIALYHPLTFFQEYSKTRESHLSTRKHKDDFDNFRMIFKEPKDDFANLISYDTFKDVESSIVKYIDNNNIGTVIIWWNSTEELARSTPGISASRWDRALQELLMGPGPLKVYTNKKTFIQGIFDLFSSLGEESVTDFIAWLTITQLAPLMNAHLAAFWLDKPGTLQDEAPLLCIKFTERYLGWITFFPLRDAYFDAESRQDIDDITNNLERTTKLRIAKNQWALNRGAQVDFKIVHQMMRLVDMTREQLEQIYINFADMGTSISMNILSAASSYHNSSSLAKQRVMTDMMNEPVYRVFSPFTMRPIPPYMASLPVYAYGATTAIKYGGLGAILAAPFFGLTYRIITKYARERTRCYTTSAVFIEAAIVNRFVERAASLDTLLDSYLSAKGEADHRLRGLREYSEDQVFFIAFCHTLCSSTRLQYLCNEPLRNSVKFAEAFRCAKGSIMNPSKKCAFLN
ncbi:uncharacterized protein LOC135398001 [Ornithodoros turicata]|uniref:uncharacterized protein LOC135398001 n=1 Tax=Ornithodoros turicata TaxID=34597 RepID=UPI003139E938